MEKLKERLLEVLEKSLNFTQTCLYELCNSCSLFVLRLHFYLSLQVTKESGPPHMKNFVTHCVVGTLQTEAEGNSKKLSKKRAAEMMLAELKKLPQLPAIIARPRTKPAINKKKNRNLIKVSEVMVLSYLYY